MFRNQFSALARGGHTKNAAFVPCLQNIWLHGFTYIAQLKVAIVNLRVGLQYNRLM